jgi:hypothetical protein
MKLHSTLIATAFAALSTFTADAALITWGSAQNIAGDSDVSLDGTLVGAFNGSLNGGPAVVTVNGVDFARVSIFFPATGIFSFANSGGAGGTNNVTASAPFSSLSASYQSLLAQNIESNPFTLTISGLTLGDAYAFQWWSNLSGSVNLSNLSATTTATAGNAVTLDANIGNVAGGLGQYVIGTFVADAFTQNVQFTGPINAGQLRQLPRVSTVPEPGTAALLGVMLAGLFGLRWGRTDSPSRGNARDS